METPFHHRLRHLASAIAQSAQPPPTPAPVAAPSAPFRVLFCGVDHPHGVAWRKSCEEAGLAIVGFVPGFGGTIASLEEEHITLPRYSSADAAIASGLDFDGAVVLLSNREGPPVCLQLASAGKHLVVEKPGVGTVADAEAILAACDASSAVLTTSYTQRFAPCAVRLQRMVADQQFGKVSEMMDFLLKKDVLQLIQLVQLNAENDASRKVISLENISATTDVYLRNPSHYLFDPAENSQFLH